MVYHAQRMGITEINMSLDFTFEELLIDLDPEPDRIDVLKLNQRNRARFMHQPSIVNHLRRAGAILAGGSLRSVIDKSTVQDYDLFTTKDVGEFKSILRFDGAKIVFECPNGELVTARWGPFKIQVVKIPTAISPLSLLESFDIIPSMLALDSRDNLWAHSKTIMCATRRIVLLNRITYPIATVGRIRKFESKGYQVPPRTWQFLFERVQELDLSVPGVWRTYID